MPGPTVLKSDVLVFHFAGVLEVIYLWHLNSKDFLENIQVNWLICFSFNKMELTKN